MVAMEKKWRQQQNKKNAIISRRNAMTKVRRRTQFISFRLAISTFWLQLQRRHCLCSEITTTAEISNRRTKNETKRRSVSLTTIHVPHFQRVEVREVKKNTKLDELCRCNFSHMKSIFSLQDIPFFLSSFIALFLLQFRKYFEFIFRVGTRRWRNWKKSRPYEMLTALLLIFISVWNGVIRRNHKQRGNQKKKNWKKWRHRERECAKRAKEHDFISAASSNSNSVTSDECDIKEKHNNNDTDGRMSGTKLERKEESGRAESGYSNWRKKQLLWKWK